MGRPYRIREASKPPVGMTWEDLDRYVFDQLKQLITLNILLGTGKRLSIPFNRSYVYFYELSDHIRDYRISNRHFELSLQSLREDGLIYKLGNKIIVDKAVIDANDHD